jgi:hypothetical protein
MHGYLNSGSPAEIALAFMFSVTLINVAAHPIFDHTSDIWLYED